MSVPKVVPSIRVISPSTPHHTFISRPPDRPHGCPYLVFDPKGNLHLPLIRFAQTCHEQYSPSTIQQYLHATLKFFDFLDTNVWQIQAHRRWDSPPEDVRAAVEDYLRSQFKCRIQTQHDGFLVVLPTGALSSSSRILLASLKAFYHSARRNGFYCHPHPLIETSTCSTHERAPQAEHRPPMPDRSGVDPPASRKRLSESYFKITGDTWVPQVIDDVDFPRHIFEGAKQLQNWSLREDCITRLLFETGGRISEVLGLTLGDWLVRGGLQEATAFNKGSQGRRVKFLRFSNNTAKLLRRYFDTQRMTCDPTGRTFSQYQQQEPRQKEQLFDLPLFLTRQHTRLSAGHYRSNFWKKACQAAGLEADVHQARHWYVTQAIRHIHQTSQDEAEIERRKRELCTYMKWRDGPQTLGAYDHYFDVERHAEIQNLLHDRLEQALQPTKPQEVELKAARGETPFESTVPACRADQEFDELIALGGEDT